jgi:hypothetical protein
MKKINLYICLAVGAVLALSACKKEYTYLATYQTTEGGAFLRVVDAAPGFRSVFNLPDSFNVYVNGAKINSPFLTYGSVFPIATTQFGYAAVPTGVQQIKLSVHGFASVQPDSTQLINFTKVFLPGQYYTLLVTDSIKSTRDSSQMFLPDAFAKPLTGNVALRFVHAVWNDTVGKTIDVFSYARNTTVGTNLKPGAVSSFSSFGYNIAVPDTFYVTRSAIAGTPLAGRIVLAKLAFAPVNQRAYTLYFRGDANLTTGTKARSLLSLIHQ